MANAAAAQDVVRALRRDIARIEGRLAETLAPVHDPANAGLSSLARTALRHAGRADARHGRLKTGVENFDAALGGGVPAAGLTEIHGHQVRDAGIAAGFAMALLSRFGLGKANAPLLWIGSSEIFREAGSPYAVGLQSAFGIEPAGLLLAEAPRMADALWIADEAASVKALSAVVVELSLNSRHIDLTATRRLHRRAAEAGRPVFLLRQSAEAAPTAAPLRFVVSPAPSGLRRILGRPLAGSIGPPAFAVALDKNRFAPPTRFVLEWNSHDRTLEHREFRQHHGSEDPVALVPLPADGTDLAAATGSRMAYGLLRFPSAAGQ